MYHEPMQSLVFDDTADAFSSAVPMNGDNALEIGLIALETPGGGATIRAQIQQSNDQNNWSAVGGALDATDPGYDATTVSGISMKFVRIRIFFNSGTGTAIASATINTRGF